MLSLLFRVPMLLLDIPAPPDEDWILDPVEPESFPVWIIVAVAVLAVAAVVLILRARKKKK